MPHASLAHRLWARTLGAWLQAKHWPSVCHVCHAWPSQTLCSGCIERFAQPVRRCPTCALALHHHICPQCVNASPLVLDACIAAVSYQFPWTDCIAKFKFHADPSLGRSLADLMRHAPWVEPAIEGASRVVAMPLSSARLRERGFNQAFELARHLAPDKADAHTLRRIEQATHQVGASRDDRLANVRDAFWVDPARLHHIHGQRLVLVDDVMTTGASLHEAARALKAAGASHITAVVFARTEAPPRPSSPGCAPPCQRLRDNGRMFHIVLVHPEIPPNTGNVIRLAANTGCALHLIEPLGFSMEDKHMRRAGLDYHEYAPVLRHASWESFLNTAQPDRARMFAMTTKGSGTAHDVQFQPGDWFVFGSETSGLPADIRDQFDLPQRLRLPMREGQRSLNLSNAVAVIVFEAWRQNGFTHKA